MEISYDHFDHFRTFVSLNGIHFQLKTTQPCPSYLLSKENCSAIVWKKSEYFGLLDCQSKHCLSNTIHAKAETLIPLLLTILLMVLLDGLHNCRRPLLISFCQSCFVHVVKGIVLTRTTSNFYRTKCFKLNFSVIEVSKCPLFLIQSTTSKS